MSDVYFYEGDFRFGDPENWEDAEVLTVDEMVDEANYGTKLEDQIEVLKEANAQLADKIKMLDLQRQNAELKLRDLLGSYRRTKSDLDDSISDYGKLADKLKIATEALEFYAEKGDLFEGYFDSDDYSPVDIGDDHNVEVLGKRARKALGKIRG